MKLTARDLAEAAKERAKLHMLNAQVYLDGVLGRFGSNAPETRRAEEVLRDARRALVKSYDALLDLDRGVPAERVL